jgi:tetraacyldisaccharide 4'-kinase
MLFHRKFPDVPVAVGEERLEAIPQLLHDHPETEAIFLDDAFQHRKISAGLNILLTDQKNLFTRDYFLPTGDLRDLKSNDKRAHIIVVTKCRRRLSEEERDEIVAEINPLPDQQIFFSTIAYGTPYHIINGRFITLDATTEVLLVTGIANPRPLKGFLEDRIHTYYMIHYNDHHIFTLDDWREIKKRFQEINAYKKIIITTEKDAVRLIKYENELVDLPVYVLPIEHEFLFNEGQNFIDVVDRFIYNFKKPSLVTNGTETFKQKQQEN